MTVKCNTNTRVKRWTGLILSRPACRMSSEGQNAQRGGCTWTPTHTHTQNAHSNLNRNSLQPESASVGHSWWLRLACRPHQPATLPAESLMNGNTGKMCHQSQVLATSSLRNIQLCCPLTGCHREEHRNHHSYNWINQTSVSLFQQAQETEKKKNSRRFYYKFHWAFDSSWRGFVSVWRIDWQASAF